MNLDDYKNIDKKYKLTINVCFETKLDLTPRILEVSEAFGLGVDETKKFTIFNNFNIGFNKGDVVFITGDSGGGKSILLNEISKWLHSKKLNSVHLSSIHINPSSRVIDIIGKNTDEAIRYLSLMGLNDAFIFLRKYEELSDGQKYRLRLAKLLESNADFIFIDEFCALLDRVTAKVISYNIQRACRKAGITLFCATTHRDILNDLNPSVVVDKKFMDDVSITYNEFVKKPISFASDVVFEEGHIQDYKVLSKYHYKNSSSRFPYKKVVTAKYKHDIVGVAVLSTPFLQTKGRTIKFNGKYSRMEKDVVSEINRLFVRGARYVISPKFRGCGLGQRLVLESLKFITNRKYLEVITAMGKYNPVFEKAGMEKIEITEETDAPTIKLDKWMKEKGLRINEINNPTYFMKFIDNLSPEDKITLVRMTGKVLHHPKIGLSSKDGKRAEVVAQENKYKKATFEETRKEILSYIPKLYSGYTIYYIMDNPYYKEDKETLDVFGV